MRATLSVIAASATIVAVSTTSAYAGTSEHSDKWYLSTTATSYPHSWNNGARVVLGKYTIALPVKAARRYVDGLAGFSATDARVITRSARKTWH